MTIFVDTSVWSLALRRDRLPDVPEIRLLRDALLAQLCIRRKLTMRTTDRDFASIASVMPLTIWQPT